MKFSSSIFHILLITMIIITFCLSGCDFNKELPLVQTDGSFSLSLFGDGSKNIDPARTPIIPEAFIATNATTSAQYSSKVILNWTPQKSVYYCRVFWFEDKTTAISEREKSITTYFTRENVSSGFFSPKLTYSKGLKGYEHAELPSGITYYYILKNYDPQGILLGVSPIATGSTSRLPYNANATQNYRPAVAEPGEPDLNGIITISWEWKEDWDFDDFIIYRSDSSKSGFIEINRYMSSSNESFEYSDNILAVNVGKYYYYRVSALLDGEETEQSNTAFGRTVKADAPEQPLWVTDDITGEINGASNALYRNKIVVQWKALDGAPEDISYNVYAKLGTEWLGPFDANNETTYSFYPYDYMDPNDATFSEIQIPNYKAFNPIIFNISAVNSDGESPPSENAIGQIIPRVQNVNASWLTDDAAVLINWNYSEDYVSLMDFTISRSESNDFSADTCEILATDVSELNYRDEQAEAGKSYWYFISAVNKEIATLSIPSDNPTGYRSESTEGVKGIMQIPQLTVSQGDDFCLTIELSDYPTYFETEIIYRHQTYNPTFEIKVAKDGDQAGSSTKPASYEDSLNYKCNPNRSFSNEIVLVSNYNQESLIIGEKTTAFGESLTDLSSSTYNKEATLPPGLVYVSARYSFRNILSSERSSEVSGYRLITNKEYAAEVLNHVTYSQHKMTNMHNKALAGDTGPEDAEWIEDNTKNDNINHTKGWIHYDPSLNLTGDPQVFVPIHYNNYVDYYLTLNDTDDPHHTGHWSNHGIDPCQTTEVNISSNGFLIGGNSSTGIYNGTLIFDLIISNANKSAGRYWIKQEGQTETEIPWDFDKAIFK